MNLLTQNEVCEMSAPRDTRFESDEQCPEAGQYEFDGFVEDAVAYLPNEDETLIALNDGDVFPKAGRPPRACYWKLVAGVRGADPVQSPAAPVPI